MDELSDFDDFVKLLITHEFTHVVHLDTILSWCPRFVDSVLGKIYAPNLSQPTWFIEGLAVLMESRQTTAGRLRSTFYDMHLRVPFLEGKVLALDAVSVGFGPLVYPGGSVPYLYGSSLLRYIEDRYGPEKVREISHRYADECIAGGINRVAWQALGRPYTTGSAATSGTTGAVPTSHSYALQKEEAERHGLTTARRLTFDAPAPRGTLAAAGLLPRRHADLPAREQRPAPRLRPPGPRHRRARGPAGSARRRAGLADAGRPRPGVPAGQLHPARLAHLRQRAHELDRPLPPRSGERVGPPADARLPRARARRVARRHAGRVRREQRRSERASSRVVPIQGGSPRVLAPDAPGLATRRRSRPTAARSPTRAGSRADTATSTSTISASGTDRALTIDRAMDVDPRFTPDGSYLLWTSDRTGIYDVYAYELATAQLYQVTNVLSGAFQPVVSNDGGTARLHRLHQRRLRPVRDAVRSEVVPARAAVRERAHRRARQARRRQRLARRRSSGAAASPMITRTTSYKPWKYMYPRTWNISFYSEALGLGRSGFISTTIGDPVGNHAVAANLLVPSRRATCRPRSATPTRACSRRSTSVSGAPPSACRA